MVNADHIRIRNKVESLLNQGFCIDEIAKQLSLVLGTRYIRGSAKWYRYCAIAKQNQKKAIEKHPGLYSKAGRIAQQKHPWIGKELGKKYGPIQGKIVAKRLRRNSEYFVKMAKRLQEISPMHSSLNMKKAHETMKKLGKFSEHQRLAAIKCMEKNPQQLKEMSKKAHKLYSLPMLALESRRKNYPYEFMGCFFNSNAEKEICKKLVEKKLIDRPIENVNTHFRIGKCHIDFFIQNKLFIEFHPPIKLKRKIETEDSYYLERRRLLDKNGFQNYPLVLISHMKFSDNKLKETEKIIHSV